MFLINQLQDSLNLWTKLRDQVNFLFAEKHQSFLQVGAIAHGECVQSTQNNKFAIFFQYFKKGGINMIFLHEDKH